jgi:hypothetical protein
VCTLLERLRKALGFQVVPKRKAFHLSRTARLVQDVAAVVCLRQENEISLDALLEDLSSLNYSIEPVQVHLSLQYLRRGDLIAIDWNNRVIKRQGLIKEYITKRVATSEMWVFILDDWLRINRTIQKKYGKINPEFQDFLSQSNVESKG